MVETPDLVGLHRAVIETAIRRTCARWRVRGTEIDDLSQHLWCVVLDRDARVLRQFEGRSAMSSYLFSVLMRGARKWLARRATVTRHESPAGDTYAIFGQLGAVDAIAEADPTRGELKRLQQALTNLRRIDRLLLRLRFDQGDTIPQIAELLDLSPKAVERRIARVLQRIRRAVTPDATPAGRQAGRQAGEAATAAVTREALLAIVFPSRMFP